MLPSAVPRCPFRAGLPARALLAIVLGLGATELAAGEECHFEKSSKQELREVPGLLLTEAQLGGQTVLAAIGTNSKFTFLLAPGLATAREVTHHQTDDGTSPQARAEYQSPTVSIALGPLRPITRRWSVFLNPPPPEFSLLAGAEIVFQGDIEIDLPAHRLRFYKQQGCPVFAPKWGDATVTSLSIERVEPREFRRVFDVQVNGHTVTASIDTTALASTIDLHAAGDAGITPASPGAIKIAEVAVPRAPSSPVYKVAIDSLTIGGETLSHIHLPMQDFNAALTNIAPENREVRTLHQPKLILGLDFLKAHRAFFAVEEGRLYLTQLAEPAFVLDTLPTAPPALNTTPPANPQSPTGAAPGQ